MTLIRDSELEYYLKTYYAYPIIKAANLEPKHVEVFIINDDDINAFVTNGQKIFINAGLILESEDPYELIGVISHEMGHIQGGHLARAHERIEIAQTQAYINMALGGIITAATGDVEKAVLTTLFGNDMALKDFLKYSRTEEKIADKLAIDNLKQAKMPIEGLLSFMKKLETESLLTPSLQSPYMRTHPVTSQRVDYITNQLEVSRKEGYKPDEHKELIKTHDRITKKLYGFKEDPNRVISKYEKEKNNKNVKYALAVTHLKKKNYKKSLGLIEELITQEKSNPYFHELKAQIEHARGDVNAAIQSYKKSLKLYDQKYKNELYYDPSLILIELAKSQLSTDKKANLKQALANLKKAAIYSKTTNISKLLSIVYGKLDDLGKSYYYLAEYYTVKKDLKNAKMKLKQAERLLENEKKFNLKIKDLRNLIEVYEKEKKEKDGGFLSLTNKSPRL
jgi:predicted Zn-dependent protease